VGKLPEASWGFDGDTAEYGSPDEIALQAASTFMGFLGSDDPEDDEDIDPNEFGGCYVEPSDQYWSSVHNTLNYYAEDLRKRGLVHLTSCSFANPNLILEVSTEMNMAKPHGRIERIDPPRD
jgi:hypothetical protein